MKMTNADRHPFKVAFNAIPPHHPLSPARVIFMSMFPERTGTNHIAPSSLLHICGVVS